MPGDGYWKHGGYKGLGFLYKKYTGPSTGPFPCDPGYEYCPEIGGNVHFSECVVCENFRVWHEADGDFKRCYYEFKDLESRGQYDGTWNDHPENFDPETFKKIQEEKRRNQELNLKAEREKVELERRAEELLKEPEWRETYGMEFREDSEEDQHEEDKEFLDEEEDEEDDEEDDDEEENF